MRLIITRHGSTTQNESGIIMGRTPGELSNLGHEQARLLGKRLAKENIDIIYTSPSKRCLDTLTDMLEKFEDKPSVQIIEDLQERDFGQLTGNPLNKSYFKLLDIDSDESQRLGIESIEQLFIRVKNFIELIEDEGDEKTIFIMTHSNNIRAMLMLFFDKSFMEIIKMYKIKNCAYTEFDINSHGEANLIIVDDVSHLG